MKSKKKLVIDAQCYEIFGHAVNFTWKHLDSLPWGPYEMSKELQPRPVRTLPPGIVLRSSSDHSKVRLIGHYAGADTTICVYAGDGWSYWEDELLHHYDAWNYLFDCYRQR